MHITSSMVHNRINDSNGGVYERKGIQDNEKSWQLEYCIWSFADYIWYCHWNYANYPWWKIIGTQK